MAMELTSNYGSYTVQGMAGSSATSGTGKKETEKTAEKAAERAGSSKTKSTAEYANELAKLVPSVEFKLGTTFSSAKSGKTLTVNPQLLEKMQSDPEKEKEMKELIKGVELAVNRLDSAMNAIGWSVVFKHDYIDENGKYRQICLVRNDFMLNMSDKLREERRKNSEKLIERSKEKAAEKKEELQEVLEEKQTEKEDRKVVPDEVTQLFKEKIAASKEGMVYLYDTDIRTILEVAKEEDEEKPAVKEAVRPGANLDLLV